MKKLALLAMIVLGSTSIASANSFSFRGSAHGSISVGTRTEAPRTDYRFTQPPRIAPVFTARTSLGKSRRATT